MTIFKIVFWSSKFVTVTLQRFAELALKIGGGALVWPSQAVDKLAVCATLCQFCK